MFLSFFDLLCVLALAIAAWFLWSSLRNNAIRAACEADRYFFLDDTVGLASLKPMRDDSGRLTLRRVYTFAYSDTGHNRRTGSGTLVGYDVVAVDLGTPSGPQERTSH